MSAAPALRFLFVHTARNRVLRQLRRVRQPRYAITLVAGIAYFALILGNPAGSRGDLQFASPATIQLLAALGIAVVVLWSWIYARDRRALAFTEAEVTFLFPAPVSRRALIHFKLARAQLLVLLNTFIWILVLNAGRNDLPAWMRGIAIWCVFSTLQLHRLGAALVRAAAGEAGWARARRQPIRYLIAAAAVLLVVGAIAQVALTLASARSPEEAARLLDAALALPLPAIVLAPFVALVRPLFVEDSGAWVRALVPSLALVGVHYAWVVASDAAFEEAAATASLARARQIRARARGLTAPQSANYSPPLVRLRPTGPPAVALLWKNVAMLLRRRRAATMLALLALAIVSAWIGRKLAPELTQIAGMLMLGWGAFLGLFGPQWVRNDLRSDLANLDLLRSYPLEGAAIVRAESAASAFILTLAQAALIAVGLIAMHEGPGVALEMRERMLIMAALVLVLPAVNFVGVMLFNGAALIFPAWVSPTASRAGGVDTLGQNVVVAGAYILGLVLVLILPAAMGGGAGYALTPALGSWALLPGAAIMSTALAFEAWLLSIWLGGVFESTDPPAAGIEAA